MQFNKLDVRLGLRAKDGDQVVDKVIHDEIAWSPNVAERARSNISVSGDAGGCEHEEQDQYALHY